MVAKAARKRVSSRELKLDLGCGQRKQDGYIGVDIAPCAGVDVVHDLRLMPWPWDDASVSAVYCSHFLEHLSGSLRMSFMDELYRIMQPGAQATIIVPYGLSRRAVQDPTHQWPPLVEASFLYFNRGWREQNGLTHYPITADFDFTYGYALSPSWAVRSQESAAFGLQQYWDVADDLHVTLTRRP